MKVIEFQNLQREEGQIFYLRKYNCDCVLELPTAREVTPIFFSIETSPFGQKTIELSLKGQVNYPLVPLKKAITEFILAEELEGRLPC